MESEDGEGERAVTCDNDSAVISALTAALRELLAAASPPLGVPLGKVEEDLRKASLPELIAALRREWDVLLEGMVSDDGCLVGG